MPDPIFGTDTSRYQPLGSYDPGAFEIINGQEPDGAGGDFTATLQRNVQEGRPQGVYIWGYPQGGYAVEQVVVRTRAVLGGDPPLGYWLDHEEAGVTQAQIDAALGVADGLGIRMGIYTYLYMLPGVNLRGRDLWLAYYPGNNDGTYQPSYSDAARQHGAKLHQFTSSANAAVGLDRNVVIDEAWYAALVGGAPIPSPPQPKDDEMQVLHSVDQDRWFLHDRGVFEMDNDQRDAILATGLPQRDILQIQIDRIGSIYPPAPVGSGDGKVKLEVKVV